MNLPRPSSKSVVAIWLSVVALALCLTASSAQAQSFVNGGFEADSWAPGWNSGQAPTGWTTAFSGNASWPYGTHNTADITEAYTPFGSQFVALCARDCSDDLPRGSIAQTVSGFVVGQQYRLTFQHAPEVHEEAPPGSEESIVNVSITGGTPASTDFSGNAVGGYFAEWTPQSLVFTANATSITFTFSGVANVDSNTESGIDEVSVAPVSSAPPPAASRVTSVPTLSFYGLALTMLAMLLVAGRYLWRSSRRK
jgi:hypothetical protein